MHVFQYICNETYHYLGQSNSEIVFSLRTIPNHKSVSPGDAGRRQPQAMTLERTPARWRRLNSRIYSLSKASPPNGVSYSSVNLVQRKNLLLHDPQQQKDFICLLHLFDLI